MQRGLSLIAMVTFLASAPLHAQQSASPIDVRAGSRVRLDAPGIVSDHFVATVISRTDDTLSVASPNSPTLAIPVQRITHLELSRGDSRAAGALHGMKWGLPIGAGFGVLGLFLIDDCKSCGTKPNRAGIIPAAAGGGAFYGAIIGAIVQHERWAPLALPPRVSFDAGTRRTTLAFSARF